MCARVRVRALAVATVWRPCTCTSSSLCHLVECVPTTIRYAGRAYPRRPVSRLPAAPADVRRRRRGMTARLYNIIIIIVRLRLVAAGLNNSRKHPFLSLYNSLAVYPTPLRPSQLNYTVPASYRVGTRRAAQNPGPSRSDCD